MKAFAQLYAELDRTTSTAAKVAALRAYFAAAAPADAAWALHVLLGNRPKRLVGPARLREWVADATGLAPWLIDECYAQVGDLAETVALLVPGTSTEALDLGSLQAWIEDRLLALAGAPIDRQRDAVLAAWRTLPTAERFVWTKLLTGAFRVGVAHGLVVRAVAEATGREPATIAHRVMGTWQPSADAWHRIVGDGDTAHDPAQPYPFGLAGTLEDPAALGDLSAWQAEWKWDGIRAQLIRRAGRVMFWSRGEERLDGRFPELEAAASHLPEGTVLDGEILGWLPESPRPLPFAALQRRIQRKAPTRAILASCPVRFVAFDLLEVDGADQRASPQHERRTRLARLLASPPPAIALAPVLAIADDAGLLAARAEAPAAGAEGLMLKRREAAYPEGRRGGIWLKWKVAPRTLDAVLVAAQAGHGRRAGLYTDYTFAVRDGDRFVTFAKAYSGLTDAELRQVDAFVRRHTRERHGPVRVVEPLLVFELAFEGVHRSTRHKSGVAVRFPRIARWRHDKTPAEIDTLATLQAMADGDA